MPSFAAALNQAEARARINYIRETATRTADPMPRQARPLPTGVQHSEEVSNGLGRIRNIKAGPDGYIYLALALIGKPGRIVRRVPVRRNS